MAKNLKVTPFDPDTRHRVMHLYYGMFVEPDLVTIGMRSWEEVEQTKKRAWEERPNECAQYKKLIKAAFLHSVRLQNDQAKLIELLSDI